MKLGCALLLLALMTTAGNQRPRPFVVELGPERITTLPANATGVRWIARGYVYSAGTFTPAPGQSAPRPPCDPEVNVPAIGTYVIFATVGNREVHAAQYVVRIGRPGNSVPIEQYSFGGWIEYVEQEDGTPSEMTLSAGMIQNGQVVTVGEGIEAGYAPRSRQCFGGRVEIRDQPTQ